ncbi:hypothetical protein ZHAS_00010942 [Anopheles sinensis]|uniref:Uncharacterized protein n=1 Tax=Anopheles sinensis TaxID=74873 RepID=A0A084VYX5_ANOSI|nr:hypothetical protein ZHAS_00010942 [Anopheles sinensis]
MVSATLGTPQALLGDGCPALCRMAVRFPARLVRVAVALNHARKEAGRAQGAPIPIRGRHRMRGRAEHSRYHLSDRTQITSDEPQNPP